MFRNFIFIFFLSCFLNANVIDDARLLNPNVLDKIGKLGKELESKTGIKVVLLTSQNKNNLSLNELVKPHLPRAPYVLLVLVPAKAGQKSGKVDLFLSDASLVDKDEILSPRPNTGSILPILVANKAEDIYNAALLNGYADICERIATSKNITLENAIGSSNRTTLNILRYLIYGSILLVVGLLTYKKYFKKRENANE